MKWRMTIGAAVAAVSMTVGWTLSHRTAEPSIRSQMESASPGHAISRVQRRIFALHERMLQSIDQRYGNYAVAERALAREAKVLLRDVHRAAREGKSHH